MGSAQTFTSIHNCSYSLKCSKFVIFKLERCSLYKNGIEFDQKEKGSIYNKAIWQRTSQFPLKTWLPEQNMALKTWLPEQNVSLKYWYRNRMWLSKMGTRTKTGQTGTHFWETLFVLEPIFERHILFRYQYLRAIFCSGNQVFKAILCSVN